MKFLVATDGSDVSDEALTYAIDLAEAVDGSVTVVHVANPNVYAEGGDEPIETAADADGRLVAESVEAAGQRGQELLDEAVELASEQGFGVEATLLYGDPVREITDFAEETGADTIVLGHRGRSDRVGPLVGSTAKSVVERATVPVTVVR